MTQNEVNQGDRTSGLSYLVTPGNGGHGSRFSVCRQGGTGRRMLKPFEVGPLATNMHSRDARSEEARGRRCVSSVVMALLDDMSSRGR